MFKSTFTTALIAALATTAFAMPSIQARGALASVNVVVCTGGPNTGCVPVPVGSDTCNNLTGGLSFLNKEISTATVPQGFVCTFFEQFGCLSSQGGADAVVLLEGTTNFFSADGTASTVSFNDLTSSFSCSPL